MFHGKPLYVAIAQRKEDRQAQLQMKYAQRMATLAGSPPAVIPTGYPPLYYTPPGVVTQIPARQGLMYQPYGVRPGWRPSGFIPPARPAFQPMPLPMVSSIPFFVLFKKFLYAIIFALFYLLHIFSGALLYIVFTAS